MARRRRRSSRRRHNPFFLGKKTAVGTSLSGRLVRSKSKKRRLSGAALISWRKAHVKGRRKVKSLVGRKRRRSNPWFLGKKTAVGTSISGRVIKSKHKGKRLGRKQLAAWRKKHVKGSYRVKSLLRGQKKSRRLNPTRGRTMSARLAVLERQVRAMAKAMTKTMRSLKSGGRRRRRLGAGRR